MRIIDADTLKAEFTGNFNEMWHYTAIRALIDCAPTIDPESLRPHAKWIQTEHAYVCSNCNIGCLDGYFIPTGKACEIAPYCQICGAKMEAEE